jgi:hypothetical protein
VKLFIICAPGEVLTPLIATEWEAHHQTFMDAAEALKMFVVELITPTRKRLAVVLNSVVQETTERAITAADYDFLCNVAWVEPPEAVAADQRRS